MADDKRVDLKKYFSANMIPKQSDFHELIDEIFMFHDNGLKKLKDKPLKLDDGEKWSLSLNSGNRLGLSIEDKNGSRIFIDESTKSIGIGTADLKPGSVLHVKGNLHVDGDLHVNGAAKREGGKTNWDSGPSDARLKDFSELSGSLEKIKRLRGVSYKWKSGSPDNVEHFGLIAQDLENVDELKCWVGKTGDGYLNIEPNDGGHQLEALTIQAIKELDSKISSVILADGSIKAAGQQGLLFVAADGAAEAAWIGCPVVDGESHLEIRAKGGIKLKAYGGTLHFLKDGNLVAEKNLTAQGNISTAGNMTVQGFIRPSAGKEKTNGILFPENIGGGSGDAAWIRYYPANKENTILEIGTSNDATDHIALNASGNIGVGTLSPTHKFHVVAQDAVGLFESTGGQAFLRLSTNEGLDNRVEITNRPGGRLSLWTAGDGDVFNITRDGNIGIGTTNPVAKLHVSGNVITSGNISFGNQTRQMLNLWGHEYGIGVQGGTLYFRTANIYSWYLNGVHNDSFCNPGTNGTRLMSLNSAGDLILSARTNPQALPNKPMCRALVDDTDLLVINYANDYKRGVRTDGDFWVKNKFRLGDKWLLSGIGDAHGNDDWLRFFDVAGGGYYGGIAAGKFWTVTGNYHSGSDIRRKKNICRLKDSLKKITALEGMQFEWRDSERELGVQLGLIAQHVEPIFPEVVEDGPDGFKGINYSGLIAPLIEAVKEQQMQINSLSEKISKLNEGK